VPRWVFKRSKIKGDDAVLVHDGDRGFPRQMLEVDADEPQERAATINGGLSSSR
jgi:hypothetical protein